MLRERQTHRVHSLQRWFETATTLAWCEKRSLFGVSVETFPTQKPLPKPDEPIYSSVTGTQKTTRALAIRATATNCIPLVLARPTCPPFLFASASPCYLTLWLGSHPRDQASTPVRHRPVRHHRWRACSCVLGALRF